MICLLAGSTYGILRNRTFMPVVSREEVGLLGVVGAANNGADGSDVPHAIALLTHRLTDAAFANVTRTLARGLRDVGVHRVYVVHLRTGNADGAARVTLEDAVVQVRLDARRSAFAPLAIARFLRTERPDLLITMPSIPSLAVLAGWWIAGRPGKLIVSEHAVMSYESWVQQPRQLKVRRVPHLARLLYPSATGIHAVSEGVRADLLDRVKIRCPLYRTAVIPNAVDLPRVRRLAQEAAPHPWLDDSREIPVIVAVGRLVTTKNHGLLIEAVSLLLHRQRPVRLLILGEGRERSRLEAAIARHRVGASVQLPGFVANPYPYMARADIFALSSDQEGCSLVLVEAMACGTPVVATVTAGSREILRSDTGVLSPVGDAVAFADALERVLADPKAIERLKAGGSERVADFAPELIARRWLRFAASLS